MQGVQLIVTMDSQGQLTVSGGIMGNKVVALGMLRLAEKVVEEFNPEAQPGILLAQGEIPAPPNNRLPR